MAKTSGVEWRPVCPHNGKGTRWVRGTGLLCLAWAGDTLCQIVESLVSESTKMLWGHQKSQRIYVEE